MVDVVFFDMNGVVVRNMVFTICSRFPTRRIKEIFEEFPELGVVSVRWDKRLSFIMREDLVSLWNDPTISPERLRDGGVGKAKLFRPKCNLPNPSPTIINNMCRQRDSQPTVFDNLLPSSRR